jgi:hypothetical protein
MPMIAIGSLAADVAVVLPLRLQPRVRARVLYAYGGCRSDADIREDGWGAEATTLCGVSPT